MQEQRMKKNYFCRENFRTVHDRKKVRQSKVRRNSNNEGLDLVYTNIDGV